MQRILHVSAELAPYYPDNIQSTTSLELAKQLYKKGNDVRVFLPRFGTINERRFQLHEVIRLSGMNIIMNDLDQPLVIKVASLPGERMQAYFIDSDEYFKRKNHYGDDEQEWFEDNGERAVFFVKGVVETIKKLNWVPDVIHVHGWMAALLPVYLKKYYANDSFFNDTKLILSIYNSHADKKVEDTFFDILSFDEIQWGKSSSIKDIYLESTENVHLVIKGEEELDAELESMINDSKKEVMEKENSELFLENYFHFIEEEINIEN